MQLKIKRFFHRLKVTVNELFISKLLLNLLRKKKGSAGRLYQVLSIPQNQLGVNSRILSDPISIPRCEPQLYYPGSIEQEYLKKLVTSGDDCTCAGIISATDVDVSFPIGMHLWKRKVFEEALLGNELFLNPKYVLDLELIPLKKKKNLSESVLLSMHWHHNFFHWLVEILPRLQLYDLAEDLHELPLIVPKSSPKFVRDSLTLTGYIDRVVFVDDGVYRFEKLHLLTRLSKSPHVSPLAIEWLNNKICGKQSCQKKRIYISRSDAKIRHLTNELDVERILSDFGFETVVMSQYTLEQQIQIFRQAEMILGSHGAAFTHLAFARPGSIFMEFFEQGHFNPAYYRIAGLRKLKYGFMVGKKDGLGFSVDTAQLKTLVEKALYSQCSS